MNLPWQAEAIIGAFFAALTAILLKIGLRDISPDWATALRTSVVFLACWAFALRSAAPALANVQGAWHWIVGSGLCTAASWIFFNRALQKGPVGAVSAIDKTSLALAAGMAFLFLGEKLSFRATLGCGFVLVGIILIAWK